MSCHQSGLIATESGLRIGFKELYREIVKPDKAKIRKHLSEADAHIAWANARCTSPEKTDTKINLSVTSYEFGPCEESVHLEADTTLGFNLLFFSFFFEKVLLCASQVASYPFGV